MRTFISILLLGLLLSACAPAEATPLAPDPTESIVPTDDPKMQRGPVYINSVDLLIAESYPVQPSVHVTGDLPTPCHRFRSQVAAPDGQNQIHVTLYSLVNPDMMCAQMLEPFDENVAIPMEGAADGTYSVWVNGDLAGEFNYPGG